MFIHELAANFLVARRVCLDRQEMEENTDSADALRLYEQAIDNLNAQWARLNIHLPEPTKQSVKWDINNENEVLLALIKLICYTQFSDEKIRGILDVYFPHPLILKL